MRVNKYFPFAFVYFFINSVGLPFGLLYTTLLSPLFYIWILLKGKKLVIAKFIVCLLPFVIAHLSVGVVVNYYFQSLLLLFGVYIFCYTFYTFISFYPRLGTLFHQLTYINFFLAIVALFALFTALKPVFWFINTISDNLSDFPRLALFTYEASYYSTLLVPLFFYFFLQLFFRKVDQQVIKMNLMVIIPLILSFSMGVLAGITLAFTLLVLFNLKVFITKKYFFYPVGSLTLAIFLFLIFSFLFYPNNPLFVRLANVFSGVDSSANGRTFEAFQLAYIIAELKSIWWGIGLGQVKVIGDEVIRTFYNYPPEVGRVNIPCAMAETLAIFGIIGAGIRLMLEVFLFFRTKVYNNYYRTSLFLFIFIYHFTGSFITNVAEYVIWILAFANVFPEFDIKTSNKPVPLNIDSNG